VSGSQLWIWGLENCVGVGTTFKRMWVDEWEERREMPRSWGVMPNWVMPILDQSGRLMNLRGGLWGSRLKPWP